MILNPETYNLVKIDARRGHRILKDLFRQNIEFNDAFFTKTSSELKISVKELKKQYKKYMEDPYFIRFYRSFDLKQDSKQEYIEGKMYNPDTGLYINLDGETGKDILKRVFSQKAIFNSKKINQISKKYKISLEELIELKNKYLTEELKIDLEISKKKTKHPRFKMWEYWKNNRLEKLEKLLKQENVESFINYLNHDKNLLYHIIEKYKDNQDQKYYDLAELTLIREIDVNHYDEYDFETVLFYCVEHNLSKIIKLLLKYNADVNFQNAGNETPLHCLLETNITERKMIKRIKLFLRYGADPNIINYRKQNCIEIAKIKELKQAYQILKVYENKNFIKIQEREKKEVIEKVIKPVNLFIRTIGLGLDKVWEFQKINYQVIEYLLDKKVSYGEINEHLTNYLANALSFENEKMKHYFNEYLEKFELELLEPYLSKV